MHKGLPTEALELTLDDVLRLQGILLEARDTERKLLRELEECGKSCRPGIEQRMLEQGRENCHDRIAGAQELYERFNTLFLKYPRKSWEE
jgi:hypothetical protein